MRPRPLFSLEILLKDCYRQPLFLYTSQRRSCISTGVSYDSGEVSNVAVLGGGITGLATAFYLSKFPNINVTLIEAKSRVGGWLNSTSVDISNGRIIFEQGPRTLRPSAPNGYLTLDLIRRLNLEPEVLVTSRNSPAAQNRYIYYPDHLVRMPGPGVSFLENLSTLITEPIFHGVLLRAAMEILQPKAEGLDDESISSFISRRFGSPVVDNIVSAVLHGIYAGNVDQLSAKSILPMLWKAEQTTGSVIRHMMTGDIYVPEKDVILMKQLKENMLNAHNIPLPNVAVVESIRKSSVFTFKTGIGRLASALEQALHQMPNVTIKMNHSVLRLERLHPERHEYDDNIKITSVSNSTEPKEERVNVYSHVISTISSKELYGIVRPSKYACFVDQTPAVTVMVVNLYYSNPTLLSVHGFGYLLPRAIPVDQNPERALGVVFDSDTTVGQDSIPGTKLTVMLGGHWWDGWDTLPDEEEAASMAKAVLARHLKITEEPRCIIATLQKDCIPQYTVGHSRRMKSMQTLLRGHFNCRLRVAGSSYTGVGLNDCVRSAFDISATMVPNQMATGLEGITNQGKWELLKAGEKLEW